MTKRHRVKISSASPSIASNWFEWKTLQYVRSYLELNPDLCCNRFDENILEDLARDLQDDEKRQLFAAAIAIPGVDEDAAKDLDAVLFERADTSGRLRNLLADRPAAFTRVVLAALDSWIARLAGTSDDGFAARLDEVCRVLELSVVERELLQIVFLHERRLGVFSRYMTDTSVWYLKSLSDTIAACTQLDRNAICVACGPRGTLLDLELLTSSSLDSTLDVDADLSNWLFGGSHAPTFLETLFDVSTPLAGAFRPVNVDARDFEISRRILASESGANLLLYGEPGTGKTTLAHALAGAAGAQMLEVRNSDEGKLAARTSNLKCALRIATKRPNCIVIVDEADLILGTGRSWSIFGAAVDKGWLNKILERSAARAIWITNEMRGIENSTLRRFDYALCFEPYTIEQRRQVWTSVVAEVEGGEAILSPSEIGDLAERYPLQPSHIADTVRRVVDLAPPREDARWMVERMLDSHARRLGLRTSSRPASKPSDPALADAVAALNVDVDLVRLTESVGRFLATPPAERNAAPVKNLCTLLYGPPGTGKTEFARNLARSLGRELQAYTASDLLDKYLGGTEKRIAAAFDRAERSDAILFIDEADSFLWSRESATRSWEVSMVNEFLKRMEDFHGVLVCASNFMDRFDEASVRRFAFKARFDWLDARGKVHFFARILSPLLPGDLALSDAQSRRLESITSIGPGDFKVVLQTHAFLAAEDRSVDRLLSALERESRLKDLRGGRTIGFAD